MNQNEWTPWVVDDDLTSRLPHPPCGVVYARECPTLVALKLEVPHPLRPGEFLFGYREIGREQCDTHVENQPGNEGKGTRAVIRRHFDSLRAEVEVVLAAIRRDHAHAVNTAKAAP